MMFIDGYSHCLVVKLIKAKSEVPKLTKEYLERAETETSEQANYFCSDGGGEYGSTSLQDYFKSKGVHHEMTNPYTPQENSVSKQMNRTLVEMACTMLSDAGLPNTYWGDAILYTTHILNRVPTRALDGDLTPHEAFTGNKPSVMHLRIFGCKAHVHIPDTKWCKLDAKSIECVFLGFAENCKVLRPVLLTGWEMEQRRFGGWRDLDYNTLRVWWLRTPLHGKAEAQGTRPSKPEKKGMHPIGNSRGIAV